MVLVVKLGCVELNVCLYEFYVFKIKDVVIYVVSIGNSSDYLMFVFRFVYCIGYIVFIFDIGFVGFYNSFVIKEVF